MNYDYVLTDIATGVNDIIKNHPEYNLCCYKSYCFAKLELKTKLHLYLTYKVNR